MAKNLSQYSVTNASLYTVDAMHPGIIEYQFQLVEEIRPPSFGDKLWSGIKFTFKAFAGFIGVLFVLGLIGAIFGG